MANVWPAGTTAPGRCVHRHDDPTTCTGCRSLAKAVGLLDRQPAPMLPGWYQEQLIDAWARACGLAGGGLFVGLMREAEQRVDERAVRV